MAYLRMLPLTLLLKTLPVPFVAFEHASDVFRQHFLPLHELPVMNIVILCDLVNRFPFFMGPRVTRALKVPSYLVRMAVISAVVCRFIDFV